MRKSTLNFVRHIGLTNTIWDIVLLALALVIMVYGYCQVQWRNADIQELQAARQKLVKLPAKVDANTQANMQMAKEMQSQLNFPWMLMLQALEQAKQTNANIQLLSMTPNKIRADIRIKGEAHEFTDISHYVESLSATKTFKDVALLNQHIEVEGRKQHYVFELSVGWRI